MKKDNSFERKKEEKISRIIGTFYDKHPFPGFNIEDYKNVKDLYYNANLYGRLLSDQIPENTKIIDFGCGTGRVSCLLGMKSRFVLGIDISDKSLEIANKLKKRLRIRNVYFKKQDLFHSNINFKADLILCIGVLHHTHNIEKAFAETISKLKAKGYVIVGVYDSYGRFITRIIRFFNKISFNRLEKSDFYINKIAKSETEKESWIYDMYRCPYESTLTIDGMLNMFKRHNIEYINSFPVKFAFNEDTFPKESEKLFRKRKEGNKLEHLLIQLGWVFSEYKRGGLVMIIGRKK